MIRHRDKIFFALFFAIQANVCFCQTPTIDKIINLQDSFLTDPVDEQVETLFAQDKFQYVRFDYISIEYERKVSDFLEQQKFFDDVFKKYEDGNNLLHIASIVGDSVIFNKVKQSIGREALIKLANTPNDNGAFPIDYCNTLNRGMFREILLMTNNLITIKSLLKEHARSILNAAIEKYINYATDLPLRVRLGDKYKGPNAMDDEELYDLMTEIIVRDHSENADLLLEAKTVIYFSACLKLRPDRIPYNIWKHIFIDDSVALDKNVKLLYKFDFAQTFCEYSLIDIAAECGSIKCFNYLIAQKSQITKNSILCATVGGNMSILTALTQRGCILDQEMLYETIKMHQHEVFKWILLHVDLSKMECDPIIYATKALNVPAVKFFVHVLKKFINSLSADSGNTALHIASKIGHYAIVSFLLNNGALVDICNVEGLTPLNLASEYGNIDVMSILLQCSNNMYLVARSAHLAAANNKVAALQFLSDHGVDMNLYDKILTYPINVAVKNGHVEATKFLYEFYKKDNVAKFFPEKTPLHLAAEFNRPEIAKMLIEQNEDVDNNQNRTNTTPLHIAVKNNNVAVVSVLLKHKSSVTAVDYPTQRTPLHYSASAIDTSIIQDLLSAGANVDAQDIFGNTSLNYTTKSKHTKASDVLLMNNASSNIINKVGARQIE